MGLCRLYLCNSLLSLAGGLKLIDTRYTVMTRKRGMEDPFNDVSKYSQKYKKQRRKVPQLDARPYVHEFFPVELHPILGIDSDEVDGKRKKGPKKKLLFSALDTLDPLGEMADGSDAEGEGAVDGVDGENGGKKRGGLLQGLLGDEGEGGDDEDEDEDQEPEEEIEDDFGDDEEVCGPFTALGYSSGSLTQLALNRVTIMRNNTSKMGMMPAMIGEMKGVVRIIIKGLISLS